MLVVGQWFICTIRADDTARRRHLFSLFSALMMEAQLENERRDFRNMKENHSVNHLDAIDNIETNVKQQKV